MTDFDASRPGGAPLGAAGPGAENGVILELDHVDFAYAAGQDPVVSDISVAVPQSGSVGLVGESGAGKTTLLRLLSGMSRPTGGAMTFDGAPLGPLRGQQGREFRRSVQMVFQDPYSSLDPKRRIGWTITEPLRRLATHDDAGKPLGRAELRARAREALVEVGLSPDDARKYPRQFSGGQRQRIAIARALACGPRVLLADEPVSALDMATRIKVLELIKSQQRERGIAVVVVSHDLSAISVLCESTVVLERGRVVEAGPTRRIIDSPQHPYTQRLISSIPRLPAS